MKSFRINLRNVIAIAICLAGTTIFASCEKEDDPNNGTGKPEAVLNLSATAENAQASLAWDEPADNGGEEITGYEITADNWADKVTKSANELSHTCTGLTNGTEYTFKVRAVNANGAGAESAATATPTVGNVPDGVLINGVVWATRNVDEPCTFVTNPEEYGGYYQWNRKDTAFLVGKKYYESNYANANSWLPENDPSPDGWRLPTSDELKMLLDVTKVSMEWITLSGIKGIRFKDIVSGNSIFIPYAGFRYDNTDYYMYYVGSRGCIWSNTQHSVDSERAYNLEFKQGNAEWIHHYKGDGMSIRPVAK